MLVEDGHLNNMDEEEAEAFNAGFASGLPGPLTRSEDHACGNGDFLFVDTEVVRDQLYQLNARESVGPDGIHPGALKELVDVMAGPLSTVCQRSWESGEVPADWKLASVTPLCRKGVREDPGSYRPGNLCPWEN